MEVPIEDSFWTFSPDGQFCVSREKFSSMGIRRASDGKHMTTLSSSKTGMLTTMAISDDGNWLAAYRHPDDLELWDLAAVRRELDQMGLGWEGALPGTVAGAGRAPETRRLVFLDRPADETTRNRPRRDPAAPSYLIDLSEFYNAHLDHEWHIGVGNDGGSDLSEVPRGVVELRGVHYDLRGLIQVGDLDVNGTHYPDSVRGIPVNQSCRGLHFLHSSIRAPRDRREAIGQYVIHYADGQSITVPLVVGHNLADWWSDPAEDASRFDIAWAGKNPQMRRRSPSGTLRLFHLGWENPRPAVPVVSVDFSWLGTQAAPFLLAITADP